MGFLGKRKLYILTGLAATPDGLYDGSFVRAAVGWWNNELGEVKDLSSGGYRVFGREEAEKLVQAVQPGNRPAFEAVASSLSMPGRHSGAVLCLAYAFGLVVDAAVVEQTREGEEGNVAFRRPRPFTDSDLIELERHFSAEGAAREYDIWTPFWMMAESVFPEKVGSKVVSSLRASFDDQVDRWSAAEGFDLRRSIGEPDYATIAWTDGDDQARLPNFVELLFEWGGRLRLGERYVADDIDLADVRFPHDQYDPIEHFYGEALERYAQLASQNPPPIPHEVEIAARMCAEWLGADADAHGRKGVSTAAIRGYLWRTVEDGPVDFLEPQLTEAVNRSLEIGDDRSPDEPVGITYYFAASQCMVDNVNTRLGSIGGLIKGPRFFEKAFWDVTDDFDELGIPLDEKTRRHSFQFGVCLADAERVFTARMASRSDDPPAS